MRPVKCRERGRLVRMLLNAYYPRGEANQHFFALRAQCGRDVRVPNNQLTDFLGEAGWCRHHDAKNNGPKLLPRAVVGLSVQRSSPVPSAC